MAYLTAADIEEIKKKKKKKQSSVNTPKYLTNKDIEEILNRKNNVNVSPIKREVPTKKSSAVGTAGRILTGVGTGFLKGSEAIADAMQYGAANVAGWVGADKAKKALIENAKYNSTKVLTGNAEKFYDPIAYKPFKTGGIGSSIAEGIGQVGSMIGSAGLLGAVSKGSKLAQLPKGGKVLNTAKTLLPSAIQGYGSGVTTGLEKGNSFNKSQDYGLGNAVVQAGSEGLFGGIGGVFGKGALDDIVVKGVTNRIKSNLGKNITRIGIKSAGEGLEENIAGVLDPIVQKMTIDKNAQGYFTDEDGKFTLNKAGQDFLVGAATSALLQSPSITQRNIETKQDKEIQPLESDTRTNVQDNVNILENQKNVLNEPKVANNDMLPINENIKKEIPTIEDIMKIKKVGKFEAPKIIQSSLEADEKYILNSQDKVKRVGMTKDFYRNMRNLFDKKTADRVTGEFDESKLNNVKLSNELANDLKENVVNKYNIQKGSKDSALIQKYGEGLIGEAELKKQSPNNWQNIIEADKYFRKQYDILIDKINASRKTIYPNVEKTILEYENKIQDTTQKIRSKQSELKATQKDTTKYENLKNQINSLHLKKQSYIATIESDEILRNKRVEKRQDYYRHFQEMAEGFNALRNILSTSSDIAPKMVGTSDFTKPNAKFSSITQRRTGNKTKYDAIGGMLDYIPTASFMINIDPQIYKFRKMTNDIKNQMGEETYANQAIQFLTEFTNTLAGKQNFIDRTTQKILDSVTWGQGRKAIKGLNWLSGRIKSNMIVGNMSSTLSQALNLPQVVGKVKNPKLLMQGLADTFNPNTDYSQAQFIMERYKSDIKSQFDTKLIEQPKKLAVWMLGALDQVVTKTGWNALYRQAIEKNIPNPIQYANNNIRDLVAGRGIGEKTILQESKVVSALLPFTVEVGNLNRVLKDFGREKDVAGLFILFIVANLLNKGIEEIGGSGKTFDPIEALKEALTEEDITVLERIGRVGGEILSNLPAGQQIAALYPEYGNKDLGLPTRDKLFGDNDPTRFGTGSMYSKIFDDPVTTLITPWGGTQIKRTTDALKMYNKDLPGSYTDSGKLRFPVKDDKLTKVQAAIFGQYASKEAREYFDKNRRPLSENQVEEVKNSKDWKEAYNLILKQREYDALGRKYEKYAKEGKSTKELQKEIDNFWK